ncbi:MAG: peptidyl-prolyl cis-trans isomerase [Bryobacteraceae bacterium]|jgi:parvulin-like peptidyl-prolyl isomerase
MKSFIFFLLTAGVWAQPAAPPANFDAGRHMVAVPPETVVATFEDGRKLTAGELTSFLAAMPPNMQQAARRDRRAFAQQFALMQRLSELADKAKLGEQSPTREALAFNRMYLLMNAQLHEVLTGISVPTAEVESFYDQNKERFTEVKVKAIYIPFSADAKGPKHLTEAEAQAKIARLRTDIVAGADFVKLVKENSEDQTSVAKDGDFGTLHSTDNLPEPIRKAVFALKRGEVSEPVKQPNGFYLFRAEEVTAQPLAQVQEAIVNELKEAKFKKWMDGMTATLNFKIQNDAFFAEGGGAAAAGK